MTCIHGFLGLPSDWDALTCTANAEKVDWLPVLAGLELGPDCSALPALALILNEQADGEFLVGYSMGGRIALEMLLAPNGGRWRRAVIVSASPGMVEETERAKRLAADLAWALSFLTNPWREVLDEWNAQAVFATDGPSPLPRPESAFNRDHLAAALTFGSVAGQRDLRPELGKIEAEILWVAGDRDLKYARLAEDCARLNPRFQSRILPNAGHRAPWSVAAAFCKLIVNFTEQAKTK